MPDTTLRPSRRLSAMLAAAGMMYNQAITAISGVIIGRVVGAGSFGIANLAKNLLQIAVIVAPLGLDLALQRFMPSRAEAPQRRMAVVRWLRLLAVGVGLVPLLALGLGLADWVARDIYPYPDFARVLLVTFIALPFAADAAVTGGAYRGVHNPAPAVIATYVLLPTARVLGCFALFLLGWRLWAIVAASTAAQVLSWLYVFTRWRRDFATPRERVTGAWGEAGHVLGYSWAMCLALLITALTRATDILVLGRYQPPAEVGRYAAVQLLVTLLAVFSAALGQTLGSAIAECHHRGDRAGIQRLLTDNMRHVSLAAAPIFAVIVFWGDRLDLALGRSFMVSPTVVVLLAANQLQIAVFGYSGFGLSMTGRHRLEAGLLFTGLVATGLLSLLLVPRFGAVGAASATLMAGVLVTQGQFHLTRLCLEIRMFRWSICTPVLLALGLGAAVHAGIARTATAGFWEVALASSLVLVVYAAVAGCWLLSPGERVQITGWLRRRAGR